MISKSNYDGLPMVSLLIPIRNEEKFIERCLNTIISQDYPSEKIEVLVFDGNSVDESVRIVKEIIRDRKNYHLFSNPRITQSAAWNIGIERSKGDIIGIVSGHSELERGYVSNAVETLVRLDVDMVGGNMTAFGETLIAQTIAEATSTPFGVGGARFHYTDREEIVDTVYMGLCWRKVYESIGGFDEELVRNQDDELSYRLRALGGSIVCNPNIRSVYYNRATLKSLQNQYFQYGMWKVRVLQKHPGQMRVRQFVPPAFAASLFVSILLSLFIPLGKHLFILIISVYLVANLVASFLVALQSGLRYLFILPIVFAILHLSYGLGFMVGLVKFINRWGNKDGKVPNWKNGNSRKEAVSK